MYSLDFTHTGHFLSHGYCSQHCCFFQVDLTRRIWTSYVFECLCQKWVNRFSNVCLFACAVDQSMKRTEGKRIGIELYFNLPALLTEAITFDLSQHFNWSFLLTFPFTMFVSPLLQFSSGMGSSPLPASFWHKAKRLQGLPWSQHREGEVAGFLKDEKGKRSVCCSIFSEYGHIAAAVVASNVQKWHIHYNFCLIKILQS